MSKGAFEYTHFKSDYCELRIAQASTPPLPYQSFSFTLITVSVGSGSLGSGPRDTKDTSG